MSHHLSFLILFTYILIILLLVEVVEWMLGYLLFVCFACCNLGLLFSEI